MKLHQLLGLAGCLLLLIAAFVPLASVNGSAITLIPIYDNFSLGDNVWVWKDVSAFAVTFLLTALLDIYFIIRKMRIGVLIASSLGLVTIIFSYISFWLTQVKTFDFPELTFGYSINGILLLAGFALVYYSGIQTPKRENYSESEASKIAHQNN